MGLMTVNFPKGAVYGLLAEFDSTRAIFHACEKMRDAGFTKWDAHTPFAVHGLDKAMGLKPSFLPWIVFVLAMLGGSSIMLLMWWTSAVDYPLVISGKPLFSWQAYLPITFEVAVLGGAVGAVGGMFAINKLPTLYHPLFKSKRFERFSDDKFFISVQSDDPKFDEAAVTELLKSIGAQHVEMVEN